MAAEQSWCLECGAPARTRLAPTPNWQLPTVAIGAIVLLAAALFAFAFVRLTGDDDTTPARTGPVIAPQPAVPPAVPPADPAPAVTATTPSKTTPTQTTAPPTTVPGQKTPPPARERRP